MRVPGLHTLRSALPFSRESKQTATPKTSSAHAEIPAHPLNMSQTWHNLLFMHWPVPAEKLQAFLPRDLEVDTFDKTGWLGLIPFGLKNLQMRGLPYVPCAAPFAEVNVRTYVKHKNKPGIFFLSIDAANPVACFVAKTFYMLPYIKSNTRMQCKQEETTVTNQRLAPHHAKSGLLDISYHPQDQPATQSKPDSPEQWLTERYRYYATSTDKTLYHCDITHPQWALQPADAEIRKNTLAEAKGIKLPPRKPLLHYSHTMDAEIGLVKKTS